MLKYDVYTERITMSRIKIADEKIIEVVRNSLSMREAAIALGIKYDTLRSHAKRLGIFKPNPAGKGLKKPKEEGKGKIPLSEILDGKHPGYKSSALRVRLISEGVKGDKCEICGLSEWNGKHIPLEIDHINGVHWDNRLENLRILCPNCHAQTPTHGSKNIANELRKAQVVERNTQCTQNASPYGLGVQISP